MVYIKSFKKNRNGKYKINFFIVIIAFIVIFESIILGKNKLKGEDIKEEEKSENIIESICQYIVGVSRDNVIATGQTSLWGSGIIVSKKGYILTNAHVSGDINNKCYIILDNTNYYEGNVVWASESLDIAFIKVNVEFRDCINLADSDKLKLGQDVYSIGNPLNMSFQKSVGKGIISGLNRSLEFEEQGKTFYMSNMIQTDAAINFGSSGGALVDIYGNLVGINTIKISDADLMGFAVPINIVYPIIDKLEQNGNFEECGLKIWCFDKYNIMESHVKQNLESGIFVAQVEGDSNAEKAGLRVGDIIKYIDTDEVNTILDFKRNIFSRNVGENVILKVSRDNKDLLINVRVEKVQ